MKRLVLIFILLTGCAYNQSQNNNNVSNVDFSEVLSLEEFIIKLNEYAENNPYPNIDN